MNFMLSVALKIWLIFYRKFKFRVMKMSKRRLEILAVRWGLLIFLIVFWVITFSLIF